MKKCAECDCEIDDRKKFCSRSCAATYNNRGKARNKKKERNNCLNCGKECSVYQAIYCSNKCQQEYKNKKYIRDWLDGKVSGTTKVGCSDTIKNWLKETRGEKCEECGWDKVNPHTGLIPIEIEHIDGKWNNNHIDNLKLLCPNCHSLTKTYKALNKGNGREWRYLLKSE